LNTDSESNTDSKGCKVPKSMNLSYRSDPYNLYLYTTLLLSINTDDIVNFKPLTKKHESNELKLMKNTSLQYFEKFFKVEY